MVKRRTVFGVVAGAVAAGLVAGVSVLWPGLDAQSTPPVNSTVWALQTGDGQRYARVNTAIGEIDTVRTASNPSQVVQTSDGDFLFSQSFGHLTRLDESMPADLDEDTLRTSPATPGGVIETVTAGDWVAYRTDAGIVFGGRIADQSAAQVDPNAKDAAAPTPTPTAASADAESAAASDADVAGDSDADETPDYTADAVAVTPDGVLFAYSATDKGVLRYDLRRQRTLGTDPVAGVGDEPKLTAVGETWFLFDASSGRVWNREAETSVELEVTGSPVLATPVSEGDATYLADDSGLIELPVEGDPQRVVGTPSTLLGTPAKPLQAQGVMLAAWTGNDSGLFWRSDDGEHDLDFNRVTLGDTRRPAFVSNGTSTILNETRSGWVWTMPDGQLVASSQNWVPDATDDNDRQSDVQAEIVLDPKPPVAEPDAFGVRAGAIASLPVLLNDHDPNEDVLSIDPGSVQGLDEAYGTVTVTDNGGRLAVNVAADASGSATFTYRVTDGTAKDGLFSKTTSVTLQVVPEKTNRAPLWCGVEDCLATWPTPEVRPGGTVTVPVLGGWVDPDGDPLLLLSAEAPDGQGIAAVTPAGEVVYQNVNTGADAAATVGVVVTVADIHGATSTRTLKVKVTPNPKLRAESFAHLDVAGAEISIDVAAHVTGTAGDLRLLDVQLEDGEEASVSVPAAGTSFDFRAEQPGSYLLRFRVGDGASEVSASARITLVDPDAEAQLSTAPVVAFVRPQEDATVDVLEAVSNPTRRVLLLSGARGTADDGATLQFDAVGQRYLRVSGTTATGEPGRLGVVDYTVSDGTNDRGARIAGQASVYLLPPARDLVPIAVDDAIIVRAGAQIDVPVLDNDVAPSGGALVLDPSKVRASTDDALAFAAGSALRYLAPQRPGTYTVSYSVYNAGAPALQSMATLHVQVIGDEQNRAPRPKVLEGRVLAGQSVKLALESFGADPDGDAVALERIETQPEHGSAAIASDGTSIVYTSVPGARGGQETFTYRLRDAQGETGTGTVRVGVLDEESNPSPITFTDVVQVQAGDASKVYVRPLDNDIDPLGGELALTAVAPNLAESFSEGEPNPEYQRWQSLLGREGEDTLVITAGQNPGTMSFLYDVESESGNTARGLVVVKVVRDTVPDYPIVRDTVLTSENRTEFTTGVDVMTGRISWTGGDAATLRLGLWHGGAGVSVAGSTLRGELATEAQIVPFAVSGVLADGTEFSTYAFLRIPAADDLTISLRQGIAPQQVREKESVTFDMQQLVIMPRDATLQVDSDVRAGGAREQARCTVSGTRVTYTAGEGSPFSDVCVVPVRVAGEDVISYLSVPIQVTALDPVPILSPASLTVSPGDTASFDMESLVTWQGRSDVANLAFAIDAPGGDFQVSQQGNAFSIIAADTAQPGRISDVVVRITSHPNVTPTRVSLRVGQPPETQPRAGTVSQQCSQADGSSCTITVTGASGEVNPFPNTPLTLQSVTASGACRGISFETVDANRVRATWGNDTPGNRCTAAFVLEDAQGRTTAGERQGTINLDLHGFPGAPAGVTESAYADGSLTLRVSRGEAGSSYPAISGFSIRRGGTEVATCDEDGVCPPISAPNGDKRTYRAVAVNSVGESRGSVETVAWAYATPAQPKVQATPAHAGDEGQKVNVRITDIDTANTGELVVTSPSGDRVTLAVGGRSSIPIDGYRIGTNTLSTITVTPTSPFEIPPGDGAGSTSGNPGTTQSNGIGIPRSFTVTNIEAEPTGTDEAKVTVSVSATSGGDGSRIEFGFPAAESDRCSADSVEWGTRTSHTYERVRGNRESATFTVCARSMFADDARSFGSVISASDSTAVPGLAPDPVGPYTFSVNRDAASTGSGFEWLLSTSLSGPRAPNGYETVPGRGEISSDRFGEDPGIDVYLRSKYFQETVSANTMRAVPADGSAPYQVRVSPSISMCTAGSTLGLDSGWFGAEQPKLTAQSIRYEIPDSKNLSGNRDHWFAYGDHVEVYADGDARSAKMVMLAADDDSDSSGDGSSDPGDGSTDPGDGSTDPGDGSTDPGDGSTDPDDGDPEPEPEPETYELTWPASSDIPPAEARAVRAQIKTDWQRWGLKPATTDGQPLTATCN